MENKHENRQTIAAELQEVCVAGIQFPSPVYSFGGREWGWQARVEEQIKNVITRKEANASSRLIALHDQREQTRRPLARVAAEIYQLDAEQINDLDVSKAFADFDNVWNALNTLEKSEVLSLLVSRIEFDNSDSSLSIEMHPAGIKSLAANLEESTT